MGYQFEQNLINNNNNNNNINNNNNNNNNNDLIIEPTIPTTSILNCNNKIKIPHSSLDSFSLDFPCELYPYISINDYTQIISQLNHYKKGQPYSPFYNAFGFFIYSMIIILLIILKSSIRSYLILSLIPIIIIVSIIHLSIIIILYRKFRREILSYFQILNRIYPNLTFQATLINRKLFHVEIIITNTLIISSNSTLQNNILTNSQTQPNNIYNHSHFGGFKYLIELNQTPLYYNYQPVYNNNNNYNTTIDIVTPK